MQHGVDRHREESQISEPRDPTVREDLSNSLHLSWRECALWPNHKAFVPGPPFGRSLFLERHRFSLPWLCRSRERSRQSDVRLTIWQVWQQHSADVLPSAFAEKVTFQQ